MEERLRRLGEALEERDGESQSYLYQHFEILRTASDRNDRYVDYCTREGAHEIVEYARIVAHKRLPSHVETLIDGVSASFRADLQGIRTYATHLCAVFDEGGVVNAHDVHPIWMWSATAAELTLLGSAHLMRPAFNGDSLRRLVRTAVASLLEEMRYLLRHPNDGEDKRKAFEDRMKHVENKLRVIANAHSFN